MEEGIVRKRHELATRTSSTTMTAEASTFKFFIAESVPIVRTGENAHPTPAKATTEPDSEVLYMADPVPPSPGKEPQRPKTRLQSRKDSWVYPDPNVFSDSNVEAGAVPGRRAESSSTASA